MSEYGNLEYEKLNKEHFLCLDEKYLLVWLTEATRSNPCLKMYALVKKTH